MDVGDELFGRYRLVRWIAQGGMGVVWEAEDLRLAQPVALKHVSFAGLRPEQVDETRERTLREARMAAHLRGHPHVVAIYDVIESDGDVWLVLEYLPSISLAEALADDAYRLNLGEAARIGAAVADALAAAHLRGIVHRDVKPGNVLIGTDGGVVKLTDFGISHAVDEGPITRANVITGTIPYMAREVARGDESTPASDVFSLGATLYHVVEGEPPFGDDANSNRLLLRVATGLMREPTRTGPLTPLVMPLLESNPATRPDAATARDQLYNFANLVSAPTQDLIPRDSNTSGETKLLPTPGARPTRRHRGRFALIATVVVLIIAALGLAVPLLVGGDDSSPVGDPVLPATVGPIALAGDPRAADPCALIDIASLRRYGQPIITRSYVLPGCRAQIARPADDDIRLNVKLMGPVQSVSDVAGQPQRLGDLTVVRRSPARGAFVTDCTRIIVLADRTRIIVEVTGRNVDLCAIAEAGTVTAVNALARSGITYQPGRTDGVQIAEKDACTLLDRAILATVPGLDPNLQLPGFANWSCNWGVSRAGATSAFLNFRLDDAFVDDYGDPTTVAGRRAWRKLTPGDDHPQECLVFVVYRPAPTPTGATEMLEVNVEGPQPANELCDRAAQLAAAAIATLPPT